MTSWRELAAQRVGDAAAQSAPVRFYGLTGDLARNLRELERMRAPRGVDRLVWRAAVDDAIGLARGGWAASALALGWSEVDLFGVGPKDSWEFAGLAVWLDGRAILMLDERTAIARDAHGNTAAFTRRGWRHGRDLGLPAPPPLWRFGRS